MDNLEVAQRVIDQLRQAGIRIALDDFGTGYATLQAIANVATSTRSRSTAASWIASSSDNESQVIVRAILGLASGLGLATTAEGIEDAEQLAYLKANGCTEGQGYLFGKAITAQEATALLKNPLTGSAAA